MKIISNQASPSSTPRVATIGFFDGVHLGHRFLIDQVKKISQEEGLESAVITFPSHPLQTLKESFKPQLLTTYQEKIELLSQTGIDNCIVLDFTKQLSNYSAEQFMKDILKEQYNIKYLVIGHDHHFGHNQNETIEDYKRYGKSLDIAVSNVPPYLLNNNIISSSAIRQLLSDGNVSSAAKELGYAYAINGTVVKGEQIGRTIGFPTANLSINDKDKLIPKGGVYAVKVEIDNNQYYGMLNIGVRPTVSDNNHTTIEVYILHFNADIYQKEMHISFIQRIRSEIKFANIEGLKEQLTKDCEAVERIKEGKN